MRILGISAFYHDSAAALLVDGRIVAAAQEERFTRKKQDARFPEHAIAYCLAEAGCKLDDVDLCGVLREAVPQIRAAAGNLSGVRAARLPVVRDGDPGLDSREAVPEGHHPPRVAEARARFRLEEPAAVHRASHEPRGERVLCLAVLRRPRCSPWTASANGARRRQRSAAATICRSSRRCTSRIRSGCSIPPSPTTPASRSIPASTSSWGSRPTASRNTPTSSSTI